MGRLIRAEALKLRTTRMWLIMLAGTVGYAVLQVVAILATAGRVEGSVELASTEGLRTVLGSGTRGFVFVVVLGILAMAGEFRHQTATSTFLVAPNRGRVVAAKLVVYTIAGLAYATIATAITLAITLPWLAIEDVRVSALGREVLHVSVGVLLSGALYGMLGVGVGALIRNQIAAVIAAVLWIALADALLVALLPAVGRWTPGGALAALTRAVRPAELGGGTGYLPMWAGGLLLAAYGLAFAVAGTRFVVRRDVT